MSDIIFVNRIRMIEIKGCNKSMQPFLFQDIKDD